MASLGALGFPTSPGVATKHRGELVISRVMGQGPEKKWVFMGSISPYL